jgi:hypothetical protein
LWHLEEISLPLMIPLIASISSCFNRNLHIPYLTLPSFQDWEFFHFGQEWKSWSSSCSSEPQDGVISTNPLGPGTSVFPFPQMINVLYHKY